VAAQRAQPQIKIPNWLPVTVAGRTSLAVNFACGGAPSGVPVRRTPLFDGLTEQVRQHPQADPPLRPCLRVSPVLYYFKGSFPGMPGPSLDNADGGRWAGGTG